MWFDNNDRDGSGSRKRSRPNRRRYSLGVNARLNVTKRAKVNQAAPYLFLFLGLVAAVIGLFFGLIEVGRQLFSGNDRFRIKNLVVRTDPGAMIGESLIREYIEISEGMNLFAPDINRERERFLSRTPNVRDIEITRHLPDTMEVVVSERVPLAYVQQKQKPDLCVDDRGWVFPSRVRQMDLPVITGHAKTLKTGNRAEGLVKDAVVLLGTLRKMPAVTEIAVAGVNVKGGFSGRPDALRVTLSENTVVDLWWEKRRDGDNVESHNMNDLRDRLHFLGGVLRRAKQEGKSLAKVNLTLDIYKENCPVSYQ